MNKADKYVLDNLKEIKENGVTDLTGNVRPRYKSDNKPAHTKYITFVNEDYDLSKGEYPISTLRPLAFKKAIGEMLVIYQKQTSNLSVFEDFGCDWWRDWEVDNTNTIGKRYGHTVKRYDLIDNLLNMLNSDMFSRRKIVSLWQEEEFKDDKKGLKPCFYSTNWEVRVVEDDIFLDMHLSSRSSDYNVAGTLNRLQYLALQMMVANHFGFKLGKFSVFTSNMHYYLRQENDVLELLDRKPSEKQPYLKLNVPVGTDFYDIKLEDFELVDFDCPYPQLKFDLAI